MQLNRDGMEEETERLFMVENLLMILRAPDVTLLASDRLEILDMPTEAL
ncbi:hypothetical protein BIZ37_13210 [Photobacterium sp. BZF1]|nr:hypothetical protein [Photobacterium sp. BZF1]MBC7003519.1 hypothetical protein [Photobacterium sp. BZF1]